MKKIIPAIFFLALSIFANAQHVPLIGDSTADALVSELSGEGAKRNLEYIATLHRMRGSAQFKSAVTFIESRLKEYNLEDVETFQIPADGKSMYGTQKARLAWEAEFGELWEVTKAGNAWKPSRKICDYESMPIVIAEDSESGDVTAELIDVGAGTDEKDYAEKDVKGKLVLTSSSPSAVVDLAVGKYGAAGILSYTQNQKTAWWKEDVNLIRWGHFESFAKVKSFCFMLSIKQATELQRRLAKGESITMHAVVKAGQHVGNYDFATAVIRGTNKKDEEIVFTCHLDHQRPGANDNASGCVTILEIARTLKKLIDEGRLKRPSRTIRFMWSPEIEGTSALLSQRAGYASKIKAVIHMDMVGGAPVTKSVFHVAGAPMSLPNFVADVGQVIGKYVNEQTDRFASGYNYRYSFASSEGGKEPLQAVIGEFHLGSDHEVYSEGSFRIPAIYMHDWPDRYIHTNFDVPANIDPTKLLRAGFIGAASGYYLASINQQHEKEIEALVAQQNAVRQANQNIRSLWAGPLNATKRTGAVYKRNPDIKGPMFVFGYSYLADKYGEEKMEKLRLLNYNGDGSYYAYEALNLVDGIRTVSQVRDVLSVEFGEIPYDIVEEYLKALESIGVIAPVPVVKK